VENMYPSIRRAEMEEEKDTSLMELTPYQLRFIDEYMKCGNKREAMMKCGYVRVS